VAAALRRFHHQAGEPSTHEIFLAISTTAVSAGEEACLPRELMKSRMTSQVGHMPLSCAAGRA
jgi:hypothetical protein